MVNEINANKNRRREKKYLWKLPIRMETVPRCMSQEYELVLQLDIEDSTRTILLGPIPNILRHLRIYFEIYPSHK